ncbi:MAG: hypothetical protein ABIR32_19830 [Ilumatobacteraceae bacterium]
MKNFDRRAIFFWLSALASFALIPVTPEKLMAVGVILGCFLLLLGGASWLDDRTRNRRT